MAILDRLVQPFWEFALPISFSLLYGLLIVEHGRRHILWFGVTAHPTAEWIANQLTEACGWEQPMVRSSSEGFDQWAFAIGGRRRAPLGKTDMLKG
jgi:hypothetical protein